MITCCHGCTEREVGCHGKCETYLKAKAKQHLINTLKNKREEKYPHHLSFVKTIIHGKIEKRPYNK